MKSKSYQSTEPKHLPVDNKKVSQMFTFHFDVNYAMLSNNAFVQSKLSILKEYPIKFSVTNSFGRAKVLDWFCKSTDWLSLKKNTKQTATADQRLFFLSIMVNSYFYQLVPSQLVLFHWSTRTFLQLVLWSTGTFSLVDSYFFLVNSYFFKKNTYDMLCFFIMALLGPLI